MTDQSRASSAEYGRRAFIDSIGGDRAYADWTRPDNRMRRLVSEFIGMAGLTFILSGGAAIFHRFGGGISGWQSAFVLSILSGLWLLCAIYFLGDISAHFNPAMTFAFALRGDMGWPMAAAYWAVQYIGAAAGSYAAVFFTGDTVNLAATHPQPGGDVAAALFEAVLTFGLVMLVLNMANGPKLNGPFVAIAVGGYIAAWGTMGGPFEGAAMNPARAFGPDLASLNFSGYWAYIVGTLLGAVVAVGVARLLRGRATAAESASAEGTPLRLDSKQ